MLDDAKTSREYTLSRLYLSIFHRFYSIVDGSPRRWQKDRRIAYNNKFI